MPSRITPYHIGAWLLSLYLGTAPVYWLPGVSLQAVVTGKALLACLSVFAVLVEAIFRNQIRLPTGLLGPPGFLILILLSTPAMLQAKETSMSLAFLFDIVLGVGVLWCFAILAREGADLPRLFLRSLYIIAAAASITLYIAATAQSVASPIEAGPVSATGFGPGRTAWSNGLALYVPATLLLFAGQPPPRYPALRQVVIVSLILGSQVLSGGRAGLLASVFVLAAFVTVRQSRVPAALLLTVLAIMATVLIQQILEHLRITDLLEYGRAFTRVDDFSASRLAGYVLALEHIRERPLLGYGFGQVLLQIPPVGVFEIHNLWLKLAAESGVLLPLFFAIMVVRVLVAARRSKSSAQLPGEAEITSPALVLIVVVGLILSQFEPRVLLGSFQNSALWWAAVGWSAAVGQANRAERP